MVCSVLALLRRVHGSTPPPQCACDETESGTKAAASAACAGAGISVKDEDIKQLYGSEARREAVLAGEVQPPPAATRLYAALNRLSFFASNAAAP